MIKSQGILKYRSQILAPTEQGQGISGVARADGKSRAQQQKTAQPLNQ